MLLGRHRAHRLWLLALFARPRLVNAEGFLVEEVTRSGEGTRPAAHADVAKFATAALPFQVAGVAELLEDDRFFPDFSKGLAAQVAGQDRQIAAGEHFAFMGNEANAGSRQ